MNIPNQHVKVTYVLSGETTEQYSIYFGLTIAEAKRAVRDLMFGTVVYVIKAEVINV